MKTVWHALLWKEWHEHKWKIAALTAVILAVTLLFAVHDQRSILIAASTGLICHGVIAGAFLGMSVAGGEATRKTLPMLQGLPIPRWKPAIVKLLVAAVTVAVPVLLLVGAVFAWSKSPWVEPFIVEEALLWDSSSFPHCWGIADWFTARVVGGILGTCSFLLWMAAAGVNRSDEYRAGAVGLLVVAITWGALGFALNHAVKAQLPNVEYGIEVLMAAAPGGPGFVIMEEGGGWWGRYLPFLLSAVIGHGCVLAWFLSRFGRTATKPAHAVVAPPTTTRAPSFALPPRRSQFTAIAWKQFRETAPLALIAAATIIAMVALYFGFGYERLQRNNVGSVLGGITMGVGFLVTMVAGIGVYLEDLKPRVNTFWRSRPVSINLWFGIKFIAGWIVLVTVFGTLWALSVTLDPRSMRPMDRHEMAAVVVFVTLIFTLLYTLAMATYCLLRQPIYAAVATFGLFFAGVYTATWYFPSNTHWSVGLACLLTAQVFATALAWLAVRRDWGWKG